jgi:SHAQKYF class myb-like DNA-binding protein
MMKPIPVVSQIYSPSIASLETPPADDNEEILPPLDHVRLPMEVPLKSKEQQSETDVALSTSGRWTSLEHEAFLRALKVYGREWKKIATVIPNRTSAQIRSHAQKYFAKTEHENFQASTEQYSVSSSSVDSTLLYDEPVPPEFYAEQMESILRNPTQVETSVCNTLVALKKRYSQLEECLHERDTSNSQSESVAMLAAQTVDAVFGPATAALELEQQHLLVAAKARYEKKRKTPPIAESNNTVSKTCRFVSINAVESNDVSECSKSYG